MSQIPFDPNYLPPEFSFIGITPSQFYDLYRSNPHKNSPERLLIEAMLIDAVLCAQGEVTAVHRDLTKRVIKEARRWLRSQSYKPFSFMWSCEALEIDPSSIRSLLLHKPMVFKLDPIPIPCQLCRLRVQPY